ncbi:MAG: acetyl-CoA synthetase [Candidatus Lokiarchaeota archaeon]|nr:acetyl-CoA synthetase [Candidatus Lokiarchaeota archaeon]
MIKLLKVMKGRHMTKYNDLKTFFHPKSIAIYGVSNTPFKFANMHLFNLLSGGYKGEIYLIHPKESTIMEFQAYRSVIEVPEPIDLVLIVAPTRVVPQILEDCGKKGIHHVICVTAGFSEIGNFEAQNQLKEVAAKYGIHIMGPNCIGVISPEAYLNCTPVPLPPPKGTAGIISHSGSWACHILFTLDEKLRLGISKIVSCGNEVNTDMVDFLEAFEEDPNITSIGLYIEGLRRPKKFLEVARRVSQKKPIIAVPIGQGEAGMRAAQSHTAAISTPSAIMNPVLKQAGILVTDSNDDMLNFLQAITSQPLPKGPRVGIVTVGGGPGTTIADLSEKLQLKVPLFSESLQEKLRAILPFTASTKNPVDVTFDMNWDNFYSKIPKLLINSGEVDSLIFYGLFSMDKWFKNFKVKNPFQSVKNLSDDGFLEASQKVMTDNFKSLIRTGRKANMPMLFTNLFLSRADPLIETIQSRGLPILLPEVAPKIMSLMWQYAKYKQNLELNKV